MRAASLHVSAARVTACHPFAKLAESATIRTHGHANIGRQVAALANLEQHAERPERYRGNA
jgi:hypothetical protein